jgi:hypothetical protein
MTMATAGSAEQKLDIGRTIQRGLEAIGNHLAGYLGLALLLSGMPAFLAEQYLLGGLAEGDIDLFLSPLFWGSILLTLLSGTLLQACVVRSAILDLSGRPADLAGSLAQSLRLLLPLIGLTILSAIVTTVGFMLLIVPGVILYIMLIVSVPVLVEERLGIIDSMGRSRELTRGSRWQIFGLLLLFILFYAIIAFLLGSVIGALGLEDRLASAVIQGITAMATALFGAALSASIYVELRTVKEGATTESLATIFE